MQNPIHYLHVFFFIGYYLCVIPFRIKRDKLTGLMQFVENRFQKVICGIVHIYGLYQFFPSFIGATNLSNTEYNSLAIFDAAALLAGFGYQVAFIIAFWFRRHLFIQIFDKIHGNDSFARRILGKRKVQFATIALCFSFAFTAVLYMLLGSGVVNVTTDGWNRVNVFNAYVTKARLTLFWDSSGIGTQGDKTATENMELITTIIYLVIKTICRIQFHFSDLSILIFALILHHVARDFAHVLKMSQVCGSSFTQIKEHYGALKVLMDAVNKVYGPVVLWWVCEAMPYYAGHFDEIFKNPDILQRVRHGVYFVNYFSILIVAADGYAKIESFKDWLYDEDNYAKVDHSTLSVLLNDLSSHNVGILGMDYFTINYDFFTATVGLLVTYAVIVVEFRTSKWTGYSGYTNIL